METTIDRRIDLPPAKYLVEQRIVGRGHQYVVTEDDGKVTKLPGVTGVLNVIAKPALINWAANQAVENAGAALRLRLEGKPSKKITLTDDWIKSIMEEAKKAPEKIKTDAADLGTLCHEYFDQFIRGEAPKDIPEPLRPAVTAFHDWIGKSQLSIVGGDTKVASLRHGYGGALDFLAIGDEGEWVLGDYKTSNGIYAEYALQVAAYVQAFHETYGIECTRAIIMRFGKKEPVEFDSKELVSINKSLAAFLDAKSLKENLSGEHFCS